MSVADQPEPTAIEGVLVVPLARIPDERGTIFHMLRATDPHFVQFGEIYFTTVYRDVVKGWHRHRDMTLNYACIDGRIKLVLYDDRDGSPSRGTLIERFLGPDDYALVVHPARDLDGLQGHDRQRDRRQLRDPPARPVAHRAPRPVLGPDPVRLGRQAPLTRARRPDRPDHRGQEWLGWLRRPASRPLATEQLHVQREPDVDGRLEVEAARDQLAAGATHRVPRIGVRRPSPSPSPPPGRTGRPARRAAR